MQKPEANTAAAPTTSVYDLLAWLELNKKPLIWAASGILAVVVIAYVYVWYRDDGEAIANAALLALSTDSQPGSRQAQAGASDFLRVAGEHAGTFAAKRARMMGAAALYAEGKYVEARREFEQVLQDAQDGPLAALAQYGIATSLDALDQRDEALAAYRQVASLYPDDVLASRAKLGAASLHEAKGQPDQALKLLEELSRPGTPGAGAAEAAVRKQQLLQRHPELVKASPVPAVVNPAAEPTPTNNLDLSPPAGAPPGR